MQTFFKELGDAVLKQWKRGNFSLPAFPKIAKAALDKRPPSKHVDLAELTRDFLLHEDQPPQTDSEFGEPEIVAYSHPRFYIQLLFWLDGTTAIHQHEFSGAFHVMHGSSIHAHYAFEKPQPITPYLRVGNLKLKKMELLESGVTVPITSGQSDIHSLFHLDSPSITVVVRTQHDPGTGPQFNYLPPGVAIDPHFSDRLMLRRKQLLDVLEQAEDPGYADLVAQMVADLDFERGFSVLHHCMGHLQHQEAWDPVIRVFKKKHGRLATGVEATLHEDVRRSSIKAMRSQIVEPEHRFFLALLMNAPSRAEVFSLVKQRFPEQSPDAVILRWAEELTIVSEDGVSLLDAVSPEPIEPDDFLAAFGRFIKRERKLRPELRAAFEQSVLSVLAL